MNDKHSSVLRPHTQVLTRGFDHAFGRLGAAGRIPQLDLCFFQPGSSRARFRFDGRARAA